MRELDVWILDYLSMLLTTVSGDGTGPFPSGSGACPEQSVFWAVAKAKRHPACNAALKVSCCILTKTPKSCCSSSLILWVEASFISTAAFLEFKVCPNGLDEAMFGSWRDLRVLRVHQ